MKQEESKASVYSGRKRDAAILSLEQERLDIIREIEKTVAAYAKSSGNRKLAKRRFRIGKGPQDFKKKYLKLK